MEHTFQVLNALKEINQTYTLSNEKIDQTLAEMQTAKICIPVIGKFSTGKSALINTLLGYSRKLLREDITPETAVPTEIVYSPDEEWAEVVRNDQSTESIEIPAYRDLSVDANTVQYIRLHLKNSFLEKIPDVMIVDMPGFESGFEVHNRAIDQYLPRSLAYILTFPADDMILRSSIGNILKELCLHDMPICVVITKYDKHNDEFDATLQNLKGNLARYLGNQPFSVRRADIDSYGAEEVKEFLEQIQQQSQQILAKKFCTSAMSALDTTEQYLRTALSSQNLTESELAEQEETLRQQMNELGTRVSSNQKELNDQLDDCIDLICANVVDNVRKEENTLIVMVLNRQDINERLNLIVRESLTREVQQRLLPKIESYVKKITHQLNGNHFGDINISFHMDLEEIKKNVVSTVVAGVAVAFLMSLPLGAIIAGALTLINKLAGEKKREEQKNQIRQDFAQDLYPKILKTVRASLKTEVSRQIYAIEQSINEEITTQTNALQQALEDVRCKQQEENQKKVDNCMQLNSDLQKISQLRAELEA
ncbi:dynamin family protein [Butyricicoccus pullicaecorum]|uniref:Dynamin N-terminal domain-containing protein n=1 Tax=Butyricicoccus pullicaecorum TaxID=501571 RepID=A0A1Y4LFZ1_9FIRM|nr:dynamin family protein [Butyricicoccus pullicaecorum]OUP54800.1 hypothetical protein B5F15_15925 [Butyricicoccus pullicaecorum]